MGGKRRRNLKNIAVVGGGRKPLSVSTRKNPGEKKAGKRENSIGKAHTTAFFSKNQLGRKKQEKKRSYK